MAEKLYTLQKAAEITGIPFKSLQTRAERGNLAVVMVVPEGKVRPIRHITWQELKKLKDGSEERSYERLKEQYFQELRAGTISKKPCSEKYIELTNTCLMMFWRHAGVNASISALNAESFRKALIDIGVNDEKRRDFISKKLNIFKAVTGFMRLLVREGIKTRDDAEAIQRLKPARKYQPLSEYPTADDVKAAITKNLNRTKGRVPYDIQLFNTLLHLYAYTGIRKMEAANLLLEDVDFGENAIRVWGKGGKRRKLPIPPSLQPVLKEWIAKHRVGAPGGWLVPQFNGQQLTATAIATRFVRFSEKLGIRITPHGLRHACATMLAMDGMPDVLIQAFLGHSDLKTTNIYLNPTSKDLFKWFEGQTKDEPSQTQVAEKKRKVVAV